MPAPPLTRVALDRLVAIRVAGDDARDFLHAQLTTDIRALPRDRAQLAAWLDARGRVRAVFIVIPCDAGFLLLADADAAEAVLAKLRLFVLRADVEFDVDASLEIWALVGESDGDDWSVRAVGDVLVIRVGRGLGLAVGPAAGLAQELGRLPDAPLVDAALAEIALGIPILPAALAERFTAHMLNLDRLGAVSFDKGCYPGQEIVARTENLGSVKRRLRRFRVASGIDPAWASAGTSIVDADGQAVGELVRAAGDGEATELLAVVKVDALAGDLTLGAGGPSLAAAD